MASSQLISGSGLAIAKTIGFFAMDFTMGTVTTFPTLSPIKTSASFIACSSVISARAFTNLVLPSSRSVLPLCNTPFLSKTRKFSAFAPSSWYNSMQAIAAAPEIDGLYIGPSDLSLDMGVSLSGWADDDRHIAAVERIFAAAKANHIVACHHGGGPAESAAPLRKAPHRACTPRRALERATCRPPRRPAR